MTRTVTIDGVIYEDQGTGSFVAIAEAEPATPLSPFSAALDNAPRLDPSSAALGGLAGDVVRSMQPYTEADPAGLLVGLLTEFGAMVGPMAEARVGFQKQPPTLFIALVGRTSHSRKGTATAEIGGLMRHVEDGWHDRHELGGFGSGEALIEQADAMPGEAILMIESELARLLAVASRDGSSVSSVLRSAWDFRRLEHRIRKTKLVAPAAPVALVGHITIDELKDQRQGLRPVECLNGFGNRVLWVYVDRRQLVPDNEPIPEHVLTPLVRRLRDALKDARQAGLMERTPDALDLWRELYTDLANDDGAGTIDALTARGEAQVIRLSIIYALLDGSHKIEAPHLEAAWEVWRYCRWSAQRIWVGGGTGDPDIDRVAAVLAGGDELTARDLDRMFQGHRSIPEIRQRAMKLGVAVEISRGGTGGRPAKVLVSADKAEEADKGGPWWTSVWFTRPGV